MTNPNTPSTQRRAALYLRSAVADDAAIEDQRRRFSAHAEAQFFSVGEVFSDNGASGMAERSGLQALRTCIESGRAEVVIATDPARIYRDIDKADEFRRFCEQHGVELVWADQPTAADESFKALFDRLRAEELARMEGRG
ncbi:recombinase family protein [Leisingera sp. NJS204]|uniref:recombinase family protein n=1 Tax=Leisingera sp. NJS204 TaxID=2508307 RepID=UPI00101101BD|nr:recombinase family protein [Leisingera sp. NJS204]QAX28722.1 recombinase family protein [Leisingera sp. NJS204]